jgi:flavin-dependent dehydrogenase
MRWIFWWSESMTRCDVAVVGGGPAGSSAAITLAGAGVRVVLLESARYPHHKVCGEFLSPECGAALAELGVSETLLARAPARIHEVRISAGGGAERLFPLPGTALGISRRLLDATLAERARAAGAEVREGTRVVSIRGTLRDGFRLELRSPSGASILSARAVIAAHGRRGALDRSLRRPFLRRRHPFIALKNHFRGEAPPGGVELVVFPGGYCGISEIEEGLVNVCLLARESVFRGRSVASFLDWMQSRSPRLRDRLSRAEPIQERWMSIAQVPFDRKAPVEGDILMAGDAAALIAPLAGDGIAMALHSGRLAARLTVEHLGGLIPAEQLPRRYAADWRREFGPRLRLARGLQSLTLRPRLVSPSLRLISAVPLLGSFLVAHTRGARLPSPAEGGGRRPGGGFGTISADRSARA